MRRAVLLVVSMVCTLAGRAHPEIEPALALLNAQIEAAPGDGALYLERGCLYFRHGEPVMAEANFQRARELAPTLPGLARAMGELELAARQPAEARRWLDEAVRADPRDAEALVLRARAWLALDRGTAARADFAAALALISMPSPALILEYAALLAPADAIRALDDGIARVGAAAPLELRALALEESSGQGEAALRRLERLAAQSERAETWLKRRGDLLARLGRLPEARAAYAAALAALIALPPWLRQSPETKSLAAELAALSSSRS